MFKELFRQPKVDINISDIYTRIENMYKNSDMQSIRPHLTSAQAEVFHKELDTLEEFELKKELSLYPKKNDKNEIDVATRTRADGKVNTGYLVSSGRIVERFYDQSGRTRFRHKIKNAFIETYFIKSNLKLNYFQKDQILCPNCGAVIKPQGDTYYCEYCGTTSKAEAEINLLSRFQFTAALKGLAWLWFIIIPGIIGGLLLESGLITQETLDKITLLFSFSVASILVILFFIFLGISLFKYLREKSILHRIKLRDPNFSLEELRSKLLRMIQTENSLIKTGLNEAFLARKIDKIILQSLNYDTKYEILTLTCQVDGIKLKRSGRKTKVKNVVSKLNLQVKRQKHVLTPVYYELDQYKCKNCGGNQIIQNQTSQICAYCGTENLLEEIDWVLA